MINFVLGFLSGCLVMEIFIVFKIEKALKNTKPNLNIDDITKMLGNNLLKELEKVSEKV